MLALAADKIAAVTGFLTADLLGPDMAQHWVSEPQLVARFGVPSNPP